MTKDFSGIMTGFALGMACMAMVVELKPSKPAPAIIVAGYHEAECVEVTHDEFQRSGNGVLTTYGEAVLQCENGLIVHVSNADKHGLSVGDKTVVKLSGELRKDIPLAMVEVVE